MIKLYNFYIDGNTGVSKMSLVEQPAVDVDFLKFKKQETEMRFSADEEKRVVFGVAMRPNYPMFRMDNIRGEFYVQFDRETIKKCSEQFMKEGHSADVNLNHLEDTNGVYLVETFIKDSDKGICPKGFEDIEDGAWFTAYKVENDDVWEKVKAGDFKGFSVEINGYIEEAEDEIEKFIKEIIL